MVTILLDTVVAVLLGATILFAIRLERRLNLLRQGRGEMQALLLAIQEMTTRAEAGIAQFKTATSTGGVALQAQLRDANTLRNDLAMLIERAERTAELLQDSTRGARSVQPAEAVSLVKDRGAAGVRPQRPRPTTLAAVEPPEAPGEAAFVKALRRAR
jgi:Domain of unknown function (DUF6468)